MATRVPFTTEFEKPLVALESKIDELKQLSGGAGVDFSDEIVKLERKAKRLWEAGSDPDHFLDPGRLLDLEGRPSLQYLYVEP